MKRFGLCGEYELRMEERPDGDYVLFYDVKYLLESVKLLDDILKASEPYLRRKKYTPRHECYDLNLVYKKCAEYLNKQEKGE